MVKFGVNEIGGSDTGCFKTKVRTVAVKFMNVRIARFGPSIDVAKESLMSPECE